MECSMKYDQDKFPLGSQERAKVQLQHGDLIKALKTIHAGNIPISSLQDDLDFCVQNLYHAKREGTILSGYDRAGVFGEFEISDLLLRLYDRGDYPTFLKQAYRFEVYAGFENRVERAIKWHEKKNLPDSQAWRVKFRKIAERLLLSESPRLETIEILEDESTFTEGSHVSLGLRPIKDKSTAKTRISRESEFSGDPYIVSRVARNKLERANRRHASTLNLIVEVLNEFGVEVKETNLIDAFAVLGGESAIFEVKSIDQNNEREQVRHAVSQLYEYRYLYSLKEASLWMVFSQKLFSEWLVEYLTNDRQIKVLWAQDGKLAGPSLDEILSFLQVNPQDELLSNSMNPSSL